MLHKVIKISYLPYKYLFLISKTTLVNYNLPKGYMMGRGILDFYLGKVSLKNTIIYSMVSAIVIAICLYTMSDYFSKILLPLGRSDYIICTLLVVVGITTIFFVLSIYRSSILIKGHLKYISYISIITIVLLTSSSTSNLINKTYNPNNIFESGILTLNNQLPAMIDKATRLERVYIENGDIYYEYTLINLSIKTINQDFTTLAMMDKVYQYSSVDKLILQLSNKKRDIHYLFRDKNKVLISKIKLF